MIGLNARSVNKHDLVYTKEYSIESRKHLKLLAPSASMYLPLLTQSDDGSGLPLNSLATLRLGRYARDSGHLRSSTDPRAFAYLHIRASCM